MLHILCSQMRKQSTRIFHKKDINITLKIIFPPNLQLIPIVTFFTLISLYCNVLERFNHCSQAGNLKVICDHLSLLTTTWIWRSVSCFSRLAEEQLQLWGSLHLAALTYGVIRVIRCGCKQTLLAFWAGPTWRADTLGNSVDSGAFPSITTSPVTRHCQKNKNKHRSAQ